MPHVNIVCKARICTKIEEGWSMRSVADEFGIGKSTVSRIYRKWREERSLSRSVGTGARKITDVYQDEALVAHMHRNPFDTVREAIRNTGFPGSVRTGSRRIRNAGLHSRVAVNKTLLTPASKEQRIGFALQHMGYDAWDKVIFSDEKIFQSSYNGQVKVYRPTGTRFDDKYINKIKRNPRFSVNVWGWLSSRGLGVVHHIRNRLNSEEYINILNNVMIPTVTQSYPDRNFMFLQDNCPVHTSAATKQWFNTNNVTCMDFPSYSGDLNVIENVWGLMARRINKQNLQVHNNEQLLQIAQTAWEEIPENYVINLIRSMPERINAVIEAEGALTKY